MADGEQTFQDTVVEQRLALLETAVVQITNHCTRLTEEHTAVSTALLAQVANNAVLSGAVTAFGLAMARTSPTGFRLVREVLSEHLRGLDPALRDRASVAQLLVDAWGTGDVGVAPKRSRPVLATVAGAPAGITGPATSATEGSVLPSGSHPPAQAAPSNPGTPATREIETLRQAIADHRADLHQVVTAALGQCADTRVLAMAIIALAGAVAEQSPATILATVDAFHVMLGPDERTRADGAEMIRSLEILDTFADAARASLTDAAARAAETAGPADHQAGGGGLPVDLPP